MSKVSRSFFQTTPRRVIKLRHLKILQLLAESCPVFTSCIHMSWTVRQLLQSGFHCIFFACAEQEDEEANTGSHLKLIVDAFIQQLPNCVNRDLIDKVRRSVAPLTNGCFVLDPVEQTDPFFTPAGCHGLLHEHEHQVQQEEACPSSLHCPQAEVKLVHCGFTHRFSLGYTAFSFVKMTLHRGKKAAATLFCSEHPQL